MKWTLLFLNLFVSDLQEDKIYGYHPNNIKNVYVVENVWVNGVDTMWVLKFNYISSADTNIFRINFLGNNNLNVDRHIKKYYNLKNWTYIYKNDRYIKAYHPIFSKKTKKSL